MSQDNDLGVFEIDGNGSGDVAHGPIMRDIMRCGRERLSFLRRRVGGFIKGRAPFAAWQSFRVPRIVRKWQQTNRLGVLRFTIPGHTIAVRSAAALAEYLD
jgi:hypothetical protein